jgi:hypothetical protein
MPRIIVTTDPVSSELTEQTPVLLDEHLHSVHLSTDHAAGQLLERLAWAVKDAESAENVRRLERRVLEERRMRQESTTGRPRKRTPARAKRPAGPSLRAEAAKPSRPAARERARGPVAA